MGGLTQCLAIRSLATIEIIIDGIVDDDSSNVSYYLFNGAKDPKNTVRNDYFNYEMVSLMHRTIAVWD